ncbi:hypothetical protein BASA81_004149 [Batrachochytrium salamandrivorans]|nr:hypothetical protein BASA81_004149 [Batrachochytrium salamandrivorans]
MPPFELELCALCPSIAEEQSARAANLVQSNVYQLDASAPSPAPTAMAGMTDIKQLAEYIAQELKETEPNQKRVIASICHAVGMERALELLNSSLNDPRVLAGRKAAGGAFIQIGNNEKKLSKNNADVGNQQAIVPREYQSKAACDIGQENAILVLPTGLGKTLTARLVFENGKQRAGTNKFTCLFVCQDRELCFQQCYSFTANKDLKLAYAMGGQLFNQWNSNKQQFESAPIALSFETWSTVLATYDVVFLTAGLMYNLWTPDVPDLTLVSLLVMDEVHHAAEGVHNFVSLVKAVVESAPRCQILGLTASPVTGSSNQAKLKQGLRNLQQNLNNAKLVIPQVPLEVIQSMTEQVKFLYNAEDEEMNRVIENLLWTLIDRTVEYRKFELPACLKNQRVFGSSVEEWAQKEEAFARGNKLAEVCFFAINRVTSVLLLVQTLGAMCAKELLSVVLALRKHSSYEDGDPTVALLTSTFCNKIAPLVNNQFTCKRLEFARNQLLGKQEKTLVRVKTKAAAYWLARELDAVGIQAQGLVGDMNESSVRLLLQDFKSPTGATKVLVATSLVEEGVDLTECNLVICYGVDGVLNSGKSMIQNRGRARMQNAAFIILCKTEQDMIRVTNMHHQVLITNQVLQQQRQERS